jgi:hypothetical protein
MGFTANKDFELIVRAYVADNEVIALCPTLSGEDF